MTVDWAAVGFGAAVAAVAAVPVVAIGAALLDGVGGFVASQRASSAPLASAALAGLAAYVLSQAIALVVNLAADDDVNVGAVVATAVPAVAFGMLGGAVARRPGRWGAS